MALYRSADIFLTSLCVMEGFISVSFGMITSCISTPASMMVAVLIIGLNI